MTVLYRTFSRDTPYIYKWSVLLTFDTTRLFSIGYLFLLIIPNLTYSTRDYLYAYTLNNQLSPQQKTYTTLPGRCANILYNPELDVQSTNHI